MPTTVPTAGEAMALAQFVQDRNEQVWKTAVTGDAFSVEAVESLRGVSNVAKLTTTGTLGYLLACLTNGENGQASRLWDILTSCGEQWQEHPDWNTGWANPARAALLANLSRPKD